MLDPISISEPTPSEQLRRLAEAVADIHNILDLIVEHGNEFIPGEAIDDFRAAWKDSKESFKSLVSQLTDEKEDDPSAELKKGVIDNQLTGKSGKIKTSLLSRLKDSFLSFYYSHPLTDEKRARALDAASNFLEFGATIVGSIPGYDKIEEIVLLGKQLISIRAKRGV